VFTGSGGAEEIVSSGMNEQSILFAALRTSVAMKRALLISIIEDVDEIVSLLATLEIGVKKKVIQKRTKAHPATFLGTGKLDEIVDDFSKDDFDVVIVNGVLRPSQHHTLEMRFGLECMDRIGVILNIFAQRAQTEEAKKQVTLARMRYELPFLREWIHKAKAGERPGFLSGGAYATEVYYEHARSHVKKIEEDLKSRSVHRDLVRSRRKDRGYFLVSVAGYTNAGKSSLVNALCDANVEVDDQLFATLSTTTRKIAHSKRRILVTDTVGFISDLPTNLVHAFKSTFEEVFLADVILLVVDASEESNVMKKKAEVCMEEIASHLEQRPLILVGTKSDLLDTHTTKSATEVLTELAGSGKWLFVSSADGRGLDDLVNLIESEHRRDCVMVAFLPTGDETNALLSKLYGLVDLTETSHSERGTEIFLSCSDDDAEKIAGWIRGAGGKIIKKTGRTRENQTAPRAELPHEAKGGP
jgi:GTP-binding protein HflX